MGAATIIGAAQAAPDWWPMFCKKLSRPQSVRFMADELLCPEKVGRQAHPLRHMPLRKRSPDPAPAGFFRCFRGLCGKG